MEKALRSTLHELGLRYRVNAAPVVGIRCKADIVFRKPKVCVFVDGCFWHGCPKHFLPPKSNRSWWLEKIEDNKSRDRLKTQILRDREWLVLRYWEHEVYESGTAKIALEIFRAVSRRRYEKES